MSQATQLLLVLILAGSLCGAGWLLVSERRPARRTARRPGTPAVIRASAPVPPAPRAPQPGRASIRSAGATPGPGEPWPAGAPPRSGSVPRRAGTAAPRHDSAPVPPPGAAAPHQPGAAPEPPAPEPARAPRWRNVSAAARIARRSDDSPAAQHGGSVQRGGGTRLPRG